jgi:hypothetical protein
MSARRHHEGARVHELGRTHAEAMTPVTALLFSSDKGKPDGQWCLYFAALRPEEAALLSTRHLALPKVGWGEFHLDGAEPMRARTGPTAGRTEPATAEDLREVPRRWDACTPQAGSGRAGGGRHVKVRRIW